MLGFLGAAVRRKVPLVLAIGLVFVVAGTALAGSGIGGVFNLGRLNTVNYLTTLQGAYSKLLQVTNTSTLASSVALGVRSYYGVPLQLVGPTNKPPMTVNSGVRVANLNVAKSGLADNATALGGVVASGYQKRVTGTCTAGQKVIGVNADGTVTCATDVDTNTTYTGTAPVIISGTSIGLAGTSRCADGSVYKFAAADGERAGWSCQPDVAGMRGVKSFAAAGPYTWTAPAGVTTVVVEAWGGGGGKGGDACLNYGGTGGAGGFVRSVVPVVPGTEYAVTVGAAGLGGAPGLSCTAGTSGGPGQPGGATTFGPVGEAVLVSGNGGGGGSPGTVVPGSTCACGHGAGGSGGNGTPTDFMLQGGPGEPGYTSGIGFGVAGEPAFGSRPRYAARGGDRPRSSGDGFLVLEW